MREKEVTYFQQHPYFSKLPSALFGISNLSKKLTTLLLRTYHPSSALHLLFYSSLFTCIFWYHISKFFVLRHYNLFDSILLYFALFYFAIFYFIAVYFLSSVYQLCCACCRIQYLITFLYHISHRILK